MVEMCVVRTTLVISHTEGGPEALPKIMRFRASVFSGICGFETIEIIYISVADVTKDFHLNKSL
jgi:hypothetical protein